MLFLSFRVGGGASFAGPAANLWHGWFWVASMLGFERWGLGLGGWVRGRLLLRVGCFIGVTCRLLACLLCYFCYFVYCVIFVILCGRRDSSVRCVISAREEGLISTK